MRIIIYIVFLCAVPVVVFGQKQNITIADSATCAQVKERGEYLADITKFVQAYDTLQYYIENCYNEHRAWMKFNTLIVCTGGLPSGQYAWEPFRDWLKSVLYLNTADSDYYCAGVDAILSTFNYFNDERGKDINGVLAVVKYIIESGKCTKWDMVYDAEKYRKYDRQKQLEKWRDTVMDSIATPLDTTLPSLEDLDLGILRGPNQGAVSASDEPHLGELIATRNPFTNILDLKYRLDKSAMIRIDIFDELGRSVYGEGIGYKPLGEYRFTINIKEWASGVYYARLSTSSGEVRTIKMIKQ